MLLIFELGLEQLCHPVCLILSDAHTMHCTVRLTITKQPMKMAILAN